MTNVHEIAGGVQTAKVEAQEQAKAARDAAVTTLETMQRTIDLGLETTGDRLQDSVIVLYGGLLATEPQILKNYEDTAENLKGKSGEPVVLVSRFARNEGCTGFGGKGYMALRHTTYVGLLEGDELLFDYDNPSCALPTSRYATLQSGPYQREPVVKEGPLPVASRRHPFSFVWHGDLDLGLQLGETVAEHELGEIELFHGPAKPIDTLTVAIGHTGIEQWLATGDDFLSPINSELGDVRDLCDALEIPKIDPVTREQRRYLGIPVDA